MNPMGAVKQYGRNINLNGTKRAVLWWSVCFLVVAAQSAELKTISATYKFDPPQIETSGDHIRLSITGCGQLHRIGEPAMPFRTARLVIPAGFTVEKAEVVPLSEPQKLEVQQPIEYAGQPNSHPPRAKVPSTSRDNRFIYASDNLYPTASAEVLSVQRMAGYDIALVRMFPVQYKALSGRLLFSPQVTLNLSLTPVSGLSEPTVRPPSQRQAAIQVASFVDNPESIRADADTLSASETPPNASFDYLLITSRNLAPAFQPLLDRKIHDGLSIKIATMETITNTVPGRDVPEKVRNYIRQSYTTWGVSYVLLGGNTTVIPCRYAFVPTGLSAMDSYLPTDLYYACLDGCWNGNGDRHWGEATDGDHGGDVDLLAEVYVGRAPVANAAQVKTFVEKSVRYETETTVNLTNALLMAIYLGDFPSGPCQGDEMYTPLRPLLDGFKLDFLHDAPQKLPQWTRTEALAAMNRSPHVVLYNGYGNSDILMRMHTPDLARLTNQSPFLACSVGCNAAQFDHGKFWPDSIGEALINGSRYGAFAAVLNARAGWFDPQYPWEYSGEFEAKLFEELLRRGHVNLGMATQCSKEDMIGQIENRGAMTYRWCYYGITLLGDPHLPFHSPTPSQYAHSPPASQTPPKGGQHENL